MKNPMDTATGHEPDSSFTCPNCGTGARGKACHGCGQPRIGPDDLRVKHALQVAREEVFHLDGKLIRTLKLLFIQPGQLTVDYLDGRRKRHLKPVQLYLFCLAVYFICHTYGLLRLPYLVAQAKQGPLIQMTTEKARRGGQTLDQFLEERDILFQETLKISYIIMDLAIFGPALFLLFRKQRPYLAQHLVMVLHFNSFVYLFGIIPVGISRLTGESLLLGLLNLGCINTYFFLAIRRVYGQGIVPSILKMAGLMFFNVLASLVCIGIAMIVALFT